MRDPAQRQLSLSLSWVCPCLFMVASVVWASLFRLHIRTILRFAQSYNPEIGLHNPKYRAVHLDNPEGKRQLLWRSLFEARTWFLILRILKGRNHSNLLCRLSQVKNKLGSMWPFFGQQMDLLGKLSTTKLWTLSAPPLAPPASTDTHWSVFGKTQKDNYKHVSE